MQTLGRYSPLPAHLRIQPSKLDARVTRHRALTLTHLTFSEAFLFLT